MKLLLISLLIPSLVLSKTSLITNKTSNAIWRLDYFNKALFWEEPTEGKVLD